MEAIKLTAATTQRDSDNYLMDNIRRQMEAAAFKAIKHKNDSELAQSYSKVENIAKVTLKELQAYEDKVIEKNRERKERSGSFVFAWMLPSKIQSSLNIWFTA